MSIKIQSIIFALLLTIPSLGTADGTASTGPSIDSVYDITYKITAAFESDPITMPLGSAGTVLSEPVINAGKIWCEIKYSDGTKGWSAEIGLKSEILIGDEVETTINLHVRDAAGGKAKKTPKDGDIIMPAGSKGTVLAGPVPKDGKTWYEIRYSDGTTGWSADIGLKSKISKDDKIKTTADDLKVRESPNGISCSPCSLNTKDNGIISYGKHQFTLASGSLYDVLKKYTKLSQTDTSKTIAESYLSRVEKHDRSLKSDATFLKLLDDAASEDAMAKAQNDIFAQNYYKEGKSQAKSDGLTSAMAIVIYVDTNVHGGLKTVRTRTAARFKGKVKDKDYNERDWLSVFLEERKNRLLDSAKDNRKKGDASNLKNAKWLENSASPNGRIGILQKLVDADNLDLKHIDNSYQISLGNFGKIYTIDAPSQIQKAVDAPGPEETALTAAIQKSDSPQSPENSSDKAKDLGGVNFSSINMNFISVNEDCSGGINFDYVLTGQKAEGNISVIDPVYASSLAKNAFMSGLALNNRKFQVNLAPWEPNRIVDEDLGHTDTGRIMLEADLQMKKDFSNYGNPCANKTGEVLWALLDEKQKDLVQLCMEKFPGEIEDAMNIEFRPVTRFWITPDMIYAYINGTEIYIINSTLNISSEPISDHSFFRTKNQNSDYLSEGCRSELERSAKEFGQYARELEDVMILPYVKYDVNHDKKYEDLRSVYISLALAQWYKKNIDPKDNIFKGFVDSSNLTGLDFLMSWNPRDVWERYNYSFQNGEYKCQKSKPKMEAGMIKTEVAIYSSGGVDFAQISDKMTLIKGMPQEVQENIKQAIDKGSVDEEKKVLLGTRIHVDLGQATLGSSAPPGGGSGHPGPEEKIRKEQHHGHPSGGNETDRDDEAIPA